MDEKLAAEIASVARIDSVKKILEVVCRTTGLGFSAVARVTETRWIACAVRDEIEFGLKPGGELELRTTLCNEIRESGEIIVIDDVATDEKYCGHHTPAKYGFRSYISVPIRLSSGQFFGTLCGIDPQPARLNTPETVGMFTLFADLIAMHLDTQARMDASQAALQSERATAQLREQFIAVLGHDLRNPLNAIAAATEILRDIPHDEESAEMLDMIKESTSRMARLINDVLDLARGRLGGGLGVRCVSDTQLEDFLKQVVGELRTAWPKREITLEMSVGQSVVCDGARLGQMLSNLIANALTHGDAGKAVHVYAGAEADAFVMSVSNRGETIPPHVAEQLFQPFFRGKGKGKQEGLGLGLYIASEIARAHSGTLAVKSSDGLTTFTFRMPLGDSGPGANGAVEAQAVASGVPST